MLKFIHTSDWHLGQSFYNYDRQEEQRDFLRQLAAIVKKEQPDALLVSGDIYHMSTPSNAAVNLYVDSMIDIHNAYPDMKIVVIAGNHDSASRLDSDERLWRLANVTVLGAPSRDKDGRADFKRHLIELKGKGIIAAVPFSYNSGFPVPVGIEVERSERAQTYFQALLDCANDNNTEGLPVVLMAHLAVENSDFTGHENTMMQCVNISELGQGYDYAALGHIHRPQNLSERAFYCGTPIPVSFDEQCPHNVNLVEIDKHGDPPRVKTIGIKNIKPLHTIPAKDPVPFEEALKLLAALDAHEPAYIRLNVEVEQYLPVNAMERAAQELDGKKCRMCDIKKTQTAVPPQEATIMTVEQFNAKTPLEIANQFFIDSTGVEMNDKQKEMFNYVYQLVQEENRQ